ncbi:hypothetical protein ACET3Z_024967 [Daucus carota]
MSLAECPVKNSFTYNTTLCACNPGYIYNTTTKACSLFQSDVTDWTRIDSGFDKHDFYSFNIPQVFQLNAITKFTQSQAILLETTLLLLFSWLLFCFLARFGSLGDGRTPWFKIRWWISRLDFSFATRHWLDDQKVVVKRKTELGGTLSIASWILFIGLFATLLYQFLSKRSIEVHNLRATNAPDLASFNNDMEFNITTISGMSCSHLRGIDNLVTGSPGFIAQRVAPLSTFANYSCHNSTMGPTIAFKCFKCQLIQDYTYISWHFLDLPNDPASAVGFQFNLTMTDHASKRRMSLVSGTLKNGSNMDNKPITYRGVDPNILKFNLFPRIYRNLHDLKLIQPLFHDFIPGSYISEINPLKDSLQSSSAGVVNVTISINFLSAYVVEIDDEKILGPVSFLADLGGLYCISVGIFFYLLVQCEYRVKKLRNEDTVMRNIRSREKAKKNWNKLRKYVKYTWNCSSLDDNYKSLDTDVCCTGMKMNSSHKEISSRKQRAPIKMDKISFNRKVTLPNEKVQRNQVHRNVKADKIRTDGGNTLPPPPPLEYKAVSDGSLTELQKHLQVLYEYNVKLRENMDIAQSMINDLTSKSSSSDLDKSSTTLHDS